MLHPYYTPKTRFLSWSVSGVYTPDARQQWVGWHSRIVGNGAQWEKILKRAGNFNWWTYNSIEIKVGGIKINVIWDLYIPKTIRCIKIYF